jgi:hypothetical protein
LRKTFEKERMLTKGRDTDNHRLVNPTVAGRRRRRERTKSSVIGALCREEEKREEEE